MDWGTKSRELDPGWTVGHSGGSSVIEPVIQLYRRFRQWQALDRFFWVYFVSSVAFIVALLLANQEIIPFFYSAIYDATIGWLPSDAATLRKLQLVSNTLLTIILIVVYLDVARSQTDQAVIQEEQAQIMEKQSEIMESHEEMMEAEFRPRVLVGQVDFEGNILRVDLSNVGRGAAVHLGLRLHPPTRNPGALD